MSDVSIDGDTLTIGFNEDIDETIPKALKFKVMNGRKKIKVKDVSVDTDVDTVVLSLKDAVEVDDVITLDYKTPIKDLRQGVVQDLAGNDLQSFKGLFVSNHTPLDAITGLSAKAASASTMADSIGDIVVDSDELLEVNRGLGLGFNSDTDVSIFFSNIFSVDGLEVIPPISDILA